MALELPRGSIFDLTGVNDRIDAVGSAFDALFGWDVFAVVVFLNDDFRRVSAHFRDRDGRGLRGWFVLGI